MGRSSQEQALQNRSKIVDRASKLFRKFGVESVSVSDIMKAMGMTAGGFYKHFDSKDALVGEAFTLSFEQASNFWADIAKGSEDAAASSASIVQQYFKRRPLDQTCPILAFAGHVSSETAGPLARSAYRGGARRLFAQFVGKQPERKQDAEVLFAAMIGAGFLAHTLNDDKWVRAVQVAVETTAKGNAASD